VLHRRRLEQEMEEEVLFHMEAYAADLERSGLSRAEALRKARLEFGGVATHKDGMRFSLGLRWFDDLLMDLRYAVRILRRSPGFTLIAVCSLALAIGANTAVFSVANEALYERLNVPAPQQLRLLTIRNPKNGAVNSSWGDWTPLGDNTTRIGVLSYPVYQQLQRENQVLGPLFAFKDLGRGNVHANGEASSGEVEMVSGNFYKEIQIEPQLGRAITPADDTPGAIENVALLSDGFWTRTFARDPNVLGRVITVNSVSFKVIGVNPRGFTGGASVQISPDVFVPLAAITLLRPASRRSGPWLTSTRMWWVQVMARTRGGVTDEKAQAALDTALAAAVRATMNPKKDEVAPRLVLEDGSRGLNQLKRSMAKPIYILLGMTAFVLLLACANLANLMLARAATRQREMGIRMALGAGRERVMRQVLTENLLIALCGGLLGAALGHMGSTLLPRLTLKAWMQTEIHVPFNWHIFAFTALITIATGVLFSTAPALQATRADVGAALKEGARSATRRSRGLSSKFIVGLQVALSTLLVAAAILFLQTLWKLSHVEPGFNVSNLVLFDMLPPNRRYPPPADIALHIRMERALAAVPGVTSVSAADVAPLSGTTSISGFEVEGRPSNRNRDGLGDNSRMVAVGNDYFKTLGIPMIAGNTFSAQNTETSKHVSVINRALAQRFFPNENPIGKRFRVGSGPEDADRWFEVIGISDNIRYANLRDEPPPLHFDLWRQDKSAGPLTYNVRSPLPPATLIPMLRHAMAQVDPDLPMIDVRTQSQQLDDSLQQEHIFASLTAGFGLLAVALACIGIYGMMAYRVTQRTQEMGVRLALGAQRSQVRGMMLQEAFWIAIAGVAAGLAAAMVLARVVKSMLYGTGSTDTLSLTSAATLLLLVTLAAAWVPSSRVARLQPVDALRHE
jgi:predicted permease